MIITSVGQTHRSNDYNPFNLSINFAKFQKDLIFFTNDKHSNVKNYNSFYNKPINSPTTAEHDFFYEINEIDFNQSVNKIDLRSDQTKVIIPRSHIGFGHYIIDTFGLIVESLKYIKNPMLVININEYVNQNWSSSNKNNPIMYVLFLKNFLEQSNIDYVFLKNNYSVAIDNFYVLHWFEHSDAVYNNIYDACTSLINVSEKIPDKKVYIKSKWFSAEGNPPDPDILSLNINEVATRRISNEKYLEDYLKDHDFIILSTSNAFNSIEDQIQYFNDVKTIFSITGSGLVNCLFMKPGGNVIDLISPFPYSIEQETFRLHSGQYQDMAYAKSHNYFGRKNLIDGKLIVEDIKNNKKFLEMLK